MQVVYIVVCFVLNIEVNKITHEEAFDKKTGELRMGFYCCNVKYLTGAYTILDKWKQDLNCCDNKESNQLMMHKNSNGLFQFTVAEEDGFWKKAWSKTTDIASTVGDKVTTGWNASKDSVVDFVSADGAGGKAYNQTASSVGDFVSADGTGGQAYNSTKNKCAADMNFLQMIVKPLEDILKIIGSTIQMLSQKLMAAIKGFFALSMSILMPMEPKQ
ncbi:unnamed protein product [Diamesa serratosioi]